MNRAMRQPTLQTLGLGGVLDIFRRGAMPVDAGGLVDAVFGPAGQRGALVISGASGIVGSGKAMQLGSRLLPWGVPVVALDLPGAPDGIGKHYPGLVRAFGPDDAGAIMQNIVRVTYDGRTLPTELDRYRPRLLLEAIPEVLQIKRAHYQLFRERFPGIGIRSVTSGFPARELGVGIAHPAFPHEINKTWETIEETPSDVTRLLWALGLIPMPMGDHWSFVLDVWFCGLMAAALRYHDARNVPYWKLDKYVRKLLGPNPLRAHDAIGAKGANFLTWSCLHHLQQQYGGLFAPGEALTDRKDSGLDWYPPNEFRPVVDWQLDEAAMAELDSWLRGPLYQMGSLMLHEERSHLSFMNTIGEVCAQFRRGVLALMREAGAEAIERTVHQYHQLYPAAAESPWYPEALARLHGPDGQQLYVNAEHDGTVGVITIGREAYNRDVDAELNRAIDWLRAAGIERLILSGDFHLATQLVGADTAEFFPALTDAAAGFAVSNDWSRTARRLHDEFATSVAFVHGKRCLGGMLELVTHCHFVVAVDDVSLGFPEVTLPVVPGMEGCHWPFRRTDAAGHARLAAMLLGGRSVAATEAVGWLVDIAAPLPQALQATWSIVTGEAGMERRPLRQEPLGGLDLGSAEEAVGGTGAARAAIAACIRDACGASLAGALDVQSRHSAEFMVTDACRRGRVGEEHRRTMAV